ncbi:MAG: lysophospholipase L1-like esterase [Verrucomicrobiales bacterium]|jgi:lysophospholipase L1-like esterase
MPRLALFIFLALTVLGVQPASARPPYPVHFDFKAGEAFAFVGDETTYDGRYCQYVENFFYTRYPDRKLIFYNAGCLNDTASDALVRFSEDVIERKIDYAIIQLGTWDGEFLDYSPEHFERYKKGMTGILSKIDGIQATPFLMSPPMFDRLTRERRMSDDTFRYRLKEMSPNYNGVMGFYTSWLREEAVIRGVRFIDAWGSLNAHVMHERQINPEFSLTPDSVQPDAGGHAVMAAEVIQTLSLERESIGSVRLNYVNAEKGWESQTEGGAITEVSGSSTRVSFIWKPISLPWALPGEASFGVEIAKIDERFNHEIVRVSGLVPNRYELLIAGELVGEEFYTDQQLLEGIALHDLPERPQFSRARLVAQMNSERYETAIRPLRDLWQKVKRTRVNFPDDKTRLTSLMTELKPQMEALRLQSREKADKIYEAAKPLGRHFEIRTYLTPEERKVLEAARKKAEAEAAAKKKAEEEAAAKKKAEEANSNS